MTADRRTYLMPLTLSLREKWPDYRIHNLVFHGHSIVTGATALSVIRPFDSYPHLTYKMLNERFPTALINIIVTALGGESAVEGMPRFAKDVLCHRPDLLLLDYAVNDRRSGLQAAQEAWRSMIDQALQHGIKLLLLTPTLDVKAAYEPAEREILCAHAEQIRGLADEYGIGLCDVFKRYERYLEQEGRIEELLVWPNHPGRAGHEIITKEIISWFPMN